MSIAAAVAAAIGMGRMFLGLLVMVFVLWIGQDVELPAGHALTVLGNEGALAALQQRADAARLGLLHGAGFVLGLVAHQHSFVVSQDHGIVGRRHEVVWHHRNLAAAVRA